MSAPTVTGDIAAAMDATPSQQVPTQIDEVLQSLTQLATEPPQINDVALTRGPAGELVFSWDAGVFVEPSLRTGTTTSTKRCVPAFYLVKDDRVLYFPQASATAPQTVQQVVEENFVAIGADDVDRLSRAVRSVPEAKQDAPTQPTPSTPTPLNPGSTAEGTNVASAPTPAAPATPSTPSAPQAAATTPATPTPARGGSSMLTKAALAVGGAGAVGALLLAAPVAVAAAALVGTAAAAAGFGARAMQTKVKQWVRPVKPTAGTPDRVTGAVAALCYANVDLARLDWTNPVVSAPKDVKLPKQSNVIRFDRMVTTWGATVRPEDIFPQGAEGVTASAKEVRMAVIPVMLELELAPETTTAPGAGAGGAGGAPVMALPQKGGSISSGRPRVTKVVAGPKFCFGVNIVEARIVRSANDARAPVVSLADLARRSNPQAVDASVPAYVDFSFGPEDEAAMAAAQKDAEEVLRRAEALLGPDAISTVTPLPADDEHAPVTALLAAAASVMDEAATACRAARTVLGVSDAEWEHMAGSGGAGCAGGAGGAPATTAPSAGCGTCAREADAPVPSVGHAGAMHVGGTPGLSGAAAAGEAGTVR